MSAQLILTDLHFSYTSAVDVLADVSVCLSTGWTGVIGPNGSGKSTLLRILADELSVAPGMLQRVPSDMVIRYCPQRVSELDDEIRTFSESWDGLALRMMAQLELEPDDLERWDTLSPGERKRWQIAAALHVQPELLLLDEPTNHLDTEARKLLYNTLSGYRGVGLLVSHDREFLDNLTYSTIRVQPGGKVQHYSGCYSDAREQWLADEAHIRSTREQLQSERRKLRRRLETASRSREKAESSVSTGKRMKGKHDTDARSVMAKGRVKNAEQKLARGMSVVRGKLERTEREVEQYRVEKQIGRSVFVLEESAPKQDLLTLRQDFVSVGDTILLHNVDVQIQRDSRIHLRGPNGCGKTTLIKELIQASQLPENRILFLPQELSEDQIDEMLHDVAHIPGQEKGRLMQIVAALGVPPERLMLSGRPSPGEARKLHLAVGLSRQAWLLILDEPTNHLDLPSIERLEEALVDYAGAILLVSHDERFARGITDSNWSIYGRALHLG